MRKSLALAGAVIGMIGAFAAAPSAAASPGIPSAPSPVATLLDPTASTPESSLHSLSDATSEAGPATASAVTWPKNFVNYRDNYKCVDDSDAHGLRVHDCSEASYDNGFQRFTATLDANGVKFRNVATGECLDGSTNQGLRTHACSTDSYLNGYQRWERYGELVDARNRYWVSWKNVATGKCLDYSPANGLRLHTCSLESLANGYQGWNY